MIAGGGQLNVKGLEDAVPVGRGGFAVVYRAFQPAFERFVAVKVFDSLTLDDMTLATFQKECRAIGRVSGRPNILTVYEAGVTESGDPYLIMPFMAGGSLQDRLRRHGPLPWRGAVAVGIKLARALQVAHDAAVLHRDVKPDNILLSEDGEPYLADFGIARLTDATRTSKSQLSFTPAHVAPEVLSGAPPTPAVDVYSLGSTLFTLIVGRPAFLEDSQDSFFVVMNRVQNAPVPGLLRSRGVPGTVRRAIEAAMAKSPADRPPSASAFATALEAGAREAALPVSAPPARAMPNAAAPPPGWSAVAVRQAHPEPVTPPPAGHGPGGNGCPAADGTSPPRQHFNEHPPMCIDPGKRYSAEMVTNKGTMYIELDPLAAPKTVNNFVFLARYHYFDGIVFHRVIPGFVLQGGDPEGRGTGGPGYKFSDELPKAGRYQLGSLAMANSGPNTNGSQFFIISGPRGMQLPPKYSLFGQVVSGLDVVAAIDALGTPGAGRPQERIVIESVTITER